MSSPYAGLPAAAGPPARTTSYGPDSAQVYDVRLPAAAPTGTTVVVVHGGFWRREWNRDHAAGQAQAFADIGHHVAVLEYRRTGMTGGGWPGTFEDVTAGVRAVRSDPSLPDRCLLVGHSAGGQLVALAAAQPWAHGLAGVVSLAGCVDLGLTQAMDLGNGAVPSFLGATPTGAHASRYRDADPALHVPAVPVVLVHGQRDDTVPIEVSESYLAAMTRADTEHADVVLHGIPGAGHFDLIDPQQPAFGTVLEVVATLGRR